MANIKSVVFLSFMASMGIMFLIVACALPVYNNWWPFFVVFFYVLAPIPTFIDRRVNSDGIASGKSLAQFITTIIVVSAFALPIILARSPETHPVILWGPCGLVITANIFIYITILGIIMMSYEDNVEYSMW